MKVYLGPFLNYVGPYQIAEKLLFWMDKEHPIVERLGEILMFGFKKPEKRRFLSSRDEKTTWLSDLCEYIHSKRTRSVYIKIDKWDSWNLDDTLGMIALPLLKQLKETTHSYAMIDVEDVPPHLQYDAVPSNESPQLTFDFYKEDDSKLYDIREKRFEWVLDEMIWAFEQIQPDYDWEDQYTSGEIDFTSVPCDFDENGEPTMYKLERGENDTFKCDYAAREKHQQRMDNGFRLFGKYFRALWD